MFETILTLISIIATIFIGILPYFKSPKNSSSDFYAVNLGNQHIKISHEKKSTIINKINNNVYINQESQTIDSQDSHEDIFCIIAIVLILAYIYYKYSTAIFFILILTGLVSFFSIFTYAKKNDIKTNTLISTYLLFCILFISAYFFKFPLYTADSIKQSSIGIEKLVFYFYQMCGAAIIESLFLFPIIQIVKSYIKRSNQFVPYKYSYIALGLFSLLISTGTLLYFIFNSNFISSSSL